MVRRTFARCAVGAATAALVGATAVAAGADIGPAPDFAITSVGPIPQSEGDVITISGVGCEEGTTPDSTWNVRVTIEAISPGPEVIWISGGASTAKQPNADGTWSFDQPFVDESASPAPPWDGVYEVRVRCTRRNGAEPDDAVELLDASQTFVFGDETTTTTQPAPTTAVDTTPTTVGGQGTTAPAPTDPPVVDSGAGDELPVTGSSTLPLLALGAGLFVAGVAASAARGRLSAR